MIARKIVTPSFYIIVDLRDSLRLKFANIFKAWSLVLSGDSLIGSIISNKLGMNTSNCASIDLPALLTFYDLT